MIMYLDEDLSKNGYGYLAGIVLVASAATDALDGMIARKFNQVTELGQILDPFADKLTQMAVGTCVVIKHIENTPLIILLSIVLIKELVMGAFSLKLLKTGKRPTEAKWYGKLGTISFYFVMLLIIFLNLNYLTITILVGIVTGIMIFAFINYGKLYFDMVRKEKI